MNFICDKIIFTTLKNIKFGCIEITNYNGKKIILGDINSTLKSKLIIKKPGFTLDIINKGSVGLAESYMRGDFETDNLTAEAVSAAIPKWVIVFSQYPSSFEESPEESFEVSAVP